MTNLKKTNKHISKEMVNYMQITSLSICAETDTCIKNVVYIFSHEDLSGYSGLLLGMMTNWICLKLQTGCESSETVLHTVTKVTSILVCYQILPGHLAHITMYLIPCILSHCLENTILTSL